MRAPEDQNETVHLQYHDKCSLPLLCNIIWGGGNRLKLYNYYSNSILHFIILLLYMKIFYLLKYFILLTLSGTFSCTQVTVNRFLSYWVLIYYRLAVLVLSVAEPVPGFIHTMSHDIKSSLCSASQKLFSEVGFRVF